MKEKVNVYQMVTDRVIEQLEKGIVPWQKPWSGAGLADGGAINYISRKPYSFLNQMLLGREANISPSSRSNLSEEISRRVQRLA